jgi:hypothetical protein
MAALLPCNARQGLPAQHGFFFFSKIGRPGRGAHRQDARRLDEGWTSRKTENGFFAESLITRTADGGRTMFKGPGLLALSGAVLLFLAAGAFTVAR